MYRFLAIPLVLLAPTLAQVGALQPGRVDLLCHRTGYRLRILCAGKGSRES